MNCWCTGEAPGLLAWNAVGRGRAGTPQSRLHMWSVRCVLLGQPPSSLWAQEGTYYKAISMDPTKEEDRSVRLGAVLTECASPVPRCDGGACGLWK